MNKEESLNLYAKIEPLIGFYEDYERLYDIYLKIITPLKPKNILDFGCGNGRFLEILNVHGFKASGVDLSGEMIDKALSRGVNALRKDIRQIEEKFDLIVAASDVLNYFDPLSLEEILGVIQSKLSDKGFFIADVNTLYGFEYVADGALIKENENSFLAIDANFENKKLTTNITFFEKTNELYKKGTQTITQYFHPSECFRKIKNLAIVKTTPIFLFDNENSDKTLMVFQKTT